MLIDLKKRYTIIIMPHSIQQAARMSDSAAFFLLGDCIEYGKGNQLFVSPGDKRTEDYATGRFGGSCDTSIRDNTRSAGESS
ncbi:MAG TPA: hypothetical protein VKE41_09305 [Roseiflexaceae bacterium]|nr:hypothetical protein [Roseiflexaceae bacterium]